MASQDLVGRPLVPFFDGDNNINDLLQLGDNEREEMDVDARIWDKELGYFVYPADKPGIKPPTLDSRNDSGSKLLLTPSMMLSSSAPDHLSSMAVDGNPVRVITDDAITRSNSTKRTLKQKSRPITPGRRRKDKEVVEEACTLKSVPVPLKKTISKGGNTISSGKLNTPLRIGKQKEQLSASGKWAWSAFQSSPDPTELPMPPFLTEPLQDFLSVANAPIPPFQPIRPLSQAANVPIVPPLPPGPPLSQPPRPTAPPESASSGQMSVELSMTQDLRRMLNIGGG